MKAGRNDPCPCGSGRKYKKCCLNKDEAAEQAPAQQVTKAMQAIAAARPPSHAPSAPAPPTDPEDPQMAARVARWEEFEGADHEQRAAIFQRTLDEPDLMDHENAFGMLDALFTEAMKRKEWDRFEGWVEALRQRVPQAYEEEKQYCLSWRIDCAVASERVDALAGPVRELAEVGGAAIDTVNRVVDVLRYHGQLPLLLDLARIAWPRVRKSKDVIPWGIEEFAERAVDYELWDYVAQHPEATAADPELRQRVDRYFEEPQWDHIDADLTRLLRPEPRQWRLEEFRLAAQSKEDRDEPSAGEAALLHLATEFLGWLHREQNVPYEKGEMARKHMVQYLVDRAAGELDDRRSLVEKMMHPRNPGAPGKPRKIEHALCPNRVTFEAYVASMLNPLRQAYYQATATLELLPSWLAFLETRGLLEPDHRARVLEQCRPLAESMRNLLRDHFDPALRRALEQ